MVGKSIKAKTYKNNNFEKTREYLKLNYKYPEFNIGFRWVLRARCGYKFDTRVAKAAKMIEEDCPERCPCCYRKIVILNWNIGFLNAIFFVNFK